MMTRSISALQCIGLFTIAFFVVGLAPVLDPAQAVYYTPESEQVTDNVNAIIGPLGQRSQANAGLNAIYRFVVAYSDVILIDSGASAHAAKLLEKAIAKFTD